MNVGLEICKACEAVARVGSCDGAQKISGLWRIYPTSVEARRDLILSEVGLGQQAITVLGQNPFLVRGQEGIPTTKLIIGNVPTLVAQSKIMDALGVVLRSPIKDEHHRDDMGELTRFKTGRRFIYVNMPKTPLPKMMRVGANFTGYLYYRVQSKGENEGGINWAQINEGKVHIKVVGNSDSSNTAPDKSKQKVDRSATQHDEVSAHNTEKNDMIERARKVLIFKQTALDAIGAGV
ncbi:hypothetical protein ElyMa_004944700 [Elysia marginata]|uniref:RRM domain-containing protein n=1 Tax=Elysia marginata TaxID=1093978 RepID=A0AAV4J4J0_9GAST|nr:hypothetical protein ElyMa_004944700 [Elysia marginata]